MAKPAEHDKMTREQKDEWAKQLIPMHEAFEICGMDIQKDHVWFWALGMPAAVIAGETKFDRDEVIEWLAHNGGKEGLRLKIEEKRKRYDDARKMPGSASGGPLVGA